MASTTEVATDGEWVSTTEVGQRLGYLTRWYLIQKLESLEIPCRRITYRAKRQWHWPTIEALIVPRGTDSK